MDETLSKVMLTVLGVIIGALATAWSSIYTARQKIKEVELNYKYKLRDGYLENARIMAPEVYIPINIILTRLSGDTINCEQGLISEKNRLRQKTLKVFRGSCENYLEDIKDLMNRGADAYLTEEVDQRLRSFNSFLKESLNASSIIAKSVLETEATFLPFVGSLSKQFEFPFWLARGWLGNTKLSLLGLSIAYRDQILGAPFASREFERRFQTDGVYLRTVIREVVLGARPET